MQHNMKDLFIFIQIGMVSSKIKKQKERREQKQKGTLEVVVIDERYPSTE